MRLSCFFIAVFFLVGCESLSSSKKQLPEASGEGHSQTLSKRFCLYETAPKGFKHNCNARYWVNLWIRASDQSWPQRKEILTALTDSEFDKLHAYILTLPNDTPYQDKLRAQLAVNDVLEGFKPVSRKAIDVIASEQNNLLMQFESALVVLEKENTSRGEKLIELQNELDGLRKKLEELLQIEATLMDKNRSTQQ